MLTREEVRAAIRFQGPPRPPRFFTRWWGEGLRAQYGDELARFDKYEEDVVRVTFPSPSFVPTDNGFYWRVPERTEETMKAYDSDAYLPDWKDLPALLENLPNTDAPGLFDRAKKSRMPPTPRVNTWSSTIGT